MARGPAKLDFITTMLRWRIALRMTICLLLLLAPLALYAQSSAVLLSYRQLQLSDSSMGSSNVNYDFGFNTNTSGPIGSVTFEYCANYQYAHGDACTKPTGFSASAVVLTSQAPYNDFGVLATSTASKTVLGRLAASNVVPQPLSFKLSGITNPANVGSNYVRIETHSAVDGTGPDIDFGIVVFATNEGIGITTEVPPYLMFCTGITIDGYNCGTATGSFISFGELSSKTARSASSQLLASTNAPYGYSVTLAGTTMTAGNNVIPAMSGGVSKVGSSQFGINGRLNGAPIVGSDPIGPGLTQPSSGYNTPDNYRFQSGDIIAHSNDTDDYRKLTVSYLVNVAAGQPAGRYAATISYICLANF